MRKLSVLIGLCLSAALGITLAARQAVTDVSPIMKDVQATQTSMRMNLANNAAADVAKDAAKLQDDFTKAQGFFKAMNAQSSNTDRALLAGGIRAHPRGAAGSDGSIPGHEGRPSDANQNGSGYDGRQWR